MKQTFKTLLALALLAGGIAPAAAMPDEREYAAIGRWRIMAVTEDSRFHYCAADTDNGRVSLRIATDGRSWQLGNPYYDNGPVRGVWGFDGWEDEATFHTDGDGWAVMDVNQHMLASLRAMSSFSIELDRGPQTWSLRGSSAAIAKAQECAANKGRAQQRNVRQDGAAPGPGAQQWVQCARENQSCDVPYRTTVRYGAGNVFTSREAVGRIGCNNAYFGDPLPGVVKSCSYLAAGQRGAPPRPAPQQWVQCARENQNCDVPYRTTVRYGAGNVFTSREAAGRIGCNNAYFGDPLPGVVKSCSYLVVQ